MICRAYIGVGSNLNDPLKQVETAITALNKLPDICVIKTSNYYRSKPLGPANQPDFINAVVAIDTSLSAHQLLQQTQEIERAQGRARSEHWGPRTIDLDILLYGDATLCTDDLTIPHPGLTEREFVLYPLAEVAPDLRLPSGQLVAALQSQCPVSLDIA